MARRSVPPKKPLPLSTRYSLQRPQADAVTLVECPCCINCKLCHGSRMVTIGDAKAYETYEKKGQR